MECVPHEVKLLAVDILDALIYFPRESARTGGLPMLAQNVNVFGELGVGKGLYNGFLPSLLRYTLSNLKKAGGEKKKKKKKDGIGIGIGNAIAGMNDDPNLEVGMAFVSATTQPNVTSSVAFSNINLLHTQRNQFEWIDKVFTLISSVVNVQSGSSAMTDCGLVPAMLSIVKAANDDDENDEEVSCDLVTKLVSFLQPQLTQSTGRGRCSLWQFENLHCGQVRANFGSRDSVPYQRADRVQRFERERVAD